MDDDSLRASGVWRVMFISVVAAAFVLAMLYLAFPANSAVRPTVDNAVVFVADVSGSMDENEKRIVRESHAAAISSPEVISAIRAGEIGRSVFAYVEFADRAEVVVDWSVIASGDDARAFSGAILEYAEHPLDLGASTSMGTGLMAAAGLMRGLEEVPLFRVVDVAGDGISTGPWSVFRDELIAMGVTINGLPMSRHSEDGGLVDWYGNSLIGGPRAFSMDLRDISQMPMAVRRKLLLEIY